MTARCVARSPRLDDSRSNKSVVVEGRSRGRETRRCRGVGRSVGRWRRPYTRQNVALRESDALAAGTLPAGRPLFHDWSSRDGSRLLTGRAWSERKNCEAWALVALTSSGGCSVWLGAVFCNAMRGPRGIKAWVKSVWRYRARSSGRKGEIRAARFAGVQCGARRQADRIGPKP